MYLKSPLRVVSVTALMALFTGLYASAAHGQSAAKADVSVDKPCTDADFLIGDWTVSRAGKEEEVTADASWKADPRSKCFLIEVWKGRNGSRDYDAILAYSNETHTWAYMWASAGGVRSRQQDGVFVGDAIRFVPVDVKIDGKVRQFSYENLGDGRVREIQRVTTDGGKTWTDEFNLIWTRKK